jgi:hypothetical protein
VTVEEEEDALDAKLYRGASLAPQHESKLKEVFGKRKVSIVEG